MCSGWGGMRRRFAEGAVGERSEMPAVRLVGGLVFDRRGSGEVAVFEAVGVAFEGEDLGVVDEPVDHRGGGDLVAEDLTPGRERLVGGDDQAGAFVAAADEHEHQGGGVRVKRDVSDLVDLCGYPHRSTCADTATMPTSSSSPV